MAAEFACPVHTGDTRWKVARRVDLDGIAAIHAFPGAEVLQRADGNVLAAFLSTYDLDRFSQRHPDVPLTRVLGQMSR